METAIEVMKNTQQDMCNASAGEMKKYAEEIRQNLTKAMNIKRNTPGSKNIKDDILKNIIASIKKASAESGLDDNLEIQELEVPKLKGNQLKLPSTALI